MKTENKIFTLMAMSLSIFQAQAVGISQAKHPNILIIIGDDCTYSDLPVYGGINLKTPHIDKLASEGMVFNKAFLSMAMCAPCRAELFTGLYPMSNGVCWNHTPARQEIRGIGQYLENFGYRTGLAGKAHLSPNSVYQFEMIGGVERRAMAETAEFNPAEIAEFIQRDDNQPFCLVVGFTMPHAPWTLGDPSKFNQENLVLPSYMADTKETRDDFSKYLAEIEELDKQTGQLMKVLDESGKSNNTLVIFTSEQGAQWPGCKWTNWNTGIHTGFIVKWPGAIVPGTRTDAMIQYCDVLPTLIEIAGGTVYAEDFNGISFLPVLKNKTDTHRDFAYFMHNNTPEGPAYSIRAVTDGMYHYIINLHSEKIYIEKHVMGQMRWHQYWPSWVFETTTSEHANNIVNRYMLRPEKELYNSMTDPDNLNNLIGNENFSAIKLKLSKALHVWMEDQNDPGKELDSWEFYNAAREGVHKH